MKMTLIKKYGETWTRIRIKKSEIMRYAKYLYAKWQIDCSRPTKANRIYLYFERPGNLL